MTWKRIAPDHYERSCRCCSGTGKEVLRRQYSACDCYDHLKVVEHPANSSGEFGVGHRVERCDKCGMFWLVYFEYGDDSIDLPSPEMIGPKLPEDDWRPG